MLYVIKMRSTKATIYLHNAHMGNQWSQLFKDSFTLCNLLPSPFANISIPEYLCKKENELITLLPQGILEPRSRNKREV